MKYFLITYTWSYKQGKQIDYQLWKGSVINWVIDNMQDEKGEPEYLRLLNALELTKKEYDRLKKAETIIGEFNSI